MIKKLMNAARRHPVISRYQVVYNQLPDDIHNNICLYWKYYVLLSYFDGADHQAISIKVCSNKLYRNSFFLFIYAKSLFLQGKYVLAIESLEKFLDFYPYYAEAVYLKSEILAIQGDKGQSWQLLESLLLYSKRKKTWQMLANLVDDRGDFDDYLSLFQTYFPIWKNSIDHDLVEYLSLAATRAGEMDFAISLWQLHYKRSLENSMFFPRKLAKKYTGQSAVRALTDFKRQMDAIHVPFFLISGTLLGCIREGRLLEHDKDIDVGVWEYIDLERFINKLRTSGYFYVLPKYSSNAIVVRHINGITIDVFIHYRDIDNYWHASGKSRWNNTPFELMEYLFLGEKYLIPKDYELYLTENYGKDWRIPKIDFDSALDTPNMQIADEKAMIIYLYKRCFYVANRERYLVALSNLGYGHDCRN